MTPSTVVVPGPAEVAPPAPLLSSPPPPPEPPVGDPCKPSG